MSIFFVSVSTSCYTNEVIIRLYWKEDLFMSKIVIVGANHAGTAAINTVLDNYGSEN